MPRRMGATRSTQTRMIPKAINITAISQGWPSVSSITLSNSAPARAPGMVPTTNAQASSSSTEVMERRRMDRSQAARYRATSWRKYTSAPISVPMCSATSKVLLSSGFCRMVQPKSQGTMIRCPELETGANSVTPWVIPSTIACRMVRDGLLGVAEVDAAILAAPGRETRRSSNRVDRRDRHGELSERRRARQLLGGLLADEQDEGRAGGAAGLEGPRVPLDDRQDLEPTADRVGVRVRSTERRDHVDAIAGFEHAGRQTRTHHERAEAARHERGHRPAGAADPRRGDGLALDEIRVEPPSDGVSDRTEPPRRRVRGGHALQPNRPLVDHGPALEVSVRDHDRNVVPGGRAERLELCRVAADEGEGAGARHDGEERHHLGPQRPPSQEHAGLLSGSGGSGGYATERCRAVNPVTPVASDRLPQVGRGPFGGASGIARTRKSSSACLPTINEVASRMRSPSASGSSSVVNRSSIVTRTFSPMSLHLEPCVRERGGAFAVALGGQGRDHAEQQLAQVSVVLSEHPDDLLVGDGRRAGHADVIVVDQRDVGVADLELAREQSLWVARHVDRLPAL